MKSVILFLVVLVSLFSCKIHVEDSSSKDTSLKMLIIRQNGGQTKTITSPVPLNCIYELKKDISRNNYLVFETTPNDSSATISFDQNTVNKRKEIYEEYISAVLITVKNGNYSTTYMVKIQMSENDPSLHSLVIKQAGKKIKLFSEPVPLVNTVKLYEIINTTNYLTVEAKSKDSSAIIYFDNERLAGIRKDYVQSQNQIKIRVRNGNNSLDYTLNIEEPKEETEIQRLVIKQKDVVLKDIIAPIPKVINVDLRDKVSFTEYVVIEVSPKKKLSDVLFDGVLSSGKMRKYESYQKTVKIILRKDSSTTEYQVNLREPLVPEPREYSVKCNIVDSIGGTNVDGANIKVYEEGKSGLLKQTDTDIAGNAYFLLEGDKYYTFVCYKKGSAASRIESLYVPANERIFLPIVMREGVKGALAIAPEVKQLSLYRVGNETLLGKKHELDFSDINTSLNITVISKSKKIIPIKDSDSKNFGIAMGIGSPFTANSLGQTFLIPVSNDQGGTIFVDSEGVVTQKFNVPLSKLAVHDGEATLYFVMYDVAGNRCEHHQRVIFKNAELRQGIENPNDKFKEFSVYSERYYRSLETFGMSKEMGCETSARVTFKFNFNTPIEVGKINILRRLYQEGDITENWELVYTKHYEKNYTGDKKATFRLCDDSLSLREGEVYQYKLEAYNLKGKITSHVATVRIMEAFNILLTSPKNRCELLLTDLKNQDFVFKISNKNLWNNADYFSFDILIHGEDSYETSWGTYYGLMFASKLRYCLDGTKELEIARLDGNYKKYGELVGSSAYKVDDLFNYNDGIVTMTNKFFAEARFSILKTSLVGKLTEGGLYYWDIQDIGMDVFNTYGSDDKGAYFTKEYPYLDSKTGKIVGTAKSRSYSYSNLDGVGGAVNGKALFIAK